MFRLEAGQPGQPRVFFTSTTSTTNKRLRLHGLRAAVLLLCLVSPDNSDTSLRLLEVLEATSSSDPECSLSLPCGCGQELAARALPHDPRQAQLPGSERALLHDPATRTPCRSSTERALPRRRSHGGPTRLFRKWRNSLGGVAQGRTWGPGIESYPLKLFFNKLKLWYRCTEVPDEIVGPLVAGRLVGRAQSIALELRLIRPDGTYDIGDAALVRLSVDQVLDPNDGHTVIQHHIPSGVQALCNAQRGLRLKDCRSFRQNGNSVSRKLRSRLAWMSTMWQRPTCG